MSHLFKGYVIFGVVVLGVALLASVIERRLWASRPLLITLTGVLIGPHGLQLLDSQVWGNPPVMLRELARLTLGISLMGAALRLPSTFIRTLWKQSALLLVGAMFGMWLTTSLLATAVLGLRPLDALLLGAILAPTDPVIAGSIVTGHFAKQHLPATLRHAISAESGANDGLALALVTLPILAKAHSGATVLTYWLTHVVVLEVGGGIALGAISGWVCGALVRRIRAHTPCPPTPMLVVSTALALTVLGAAELLGLNGLLGVFAAGFSYSGVVHARAEYAQQRVQDSITVLFEVPVFLLFGMVLPWDTWLELDFYGPAFAILVLLLRRLPVVLLMSLGLRVLRPRRRAFFVGWFGPIGVAAMLYAEQSALKENAPWLWHIATLVIALSIVVHGVTATPLTCAYSKVSHRRRRMHEHS